MKITFILICLYSITIINAKDSPRNTILLDTGWRFHLGDITNGESADLNDQNWEQVSVPHDWAICGNFDMTIDMQWTQVIEDGDTKSELRTGRTGALPMFGIGWYRKEIDLSDVEKGKQISVEFDGAMSNAQVFLNGKFVGNWAYGYSSFAFDLTPFVNFGKKNILAVKLHNEDLSSRWYSGAGLYRNVRMVITNPIHVAHWGTQITTPDITTKKGTVDIHTSIKKTSTENENIRLITEIYDSKGIKVASDTRQQKGIEGINQFIQQIEVKAPQLWNIESPNLYRAVSNVYVDNQLYDKYETTFGFRTIEFNREKGFFLNGQKTKIYGVCLHHDLGPLGAAVNVRATERQLEMMKEMGCNAIRTSHNPPSPELLELCDKMGFLVQVESFDEWLGEKNENGYNKYFDEWCERDMEAMIRRDRNHPSVIMWSIGNEVREQKQAGTAHIARRLVEVCRREDPTRPTTAGFNFHTEAIDNGLANEIDLVGFNYKPYDYKVKHDQYPDMIIYGSETASAISSRGVYKFPVEERTYDWYEDYQISSYDLDRVSWGAIPDVEFAAQEDNDFVFGEFVWTGFDYLGEPTPYNEGTPARSSYFGIVDLAGLKKDRFYLYQSHWSDEPVLHVLPHWNFPERIGQIVPVFCYTNYPKAELFVNGKSMGTRTHDKSDKYKRYRLVWEDVIYEPGEIKVVAYDNLGKFAEEKIIRTAGKPYQIKMTADRNLINADGKDLSFITVEVLDKDGNPCPTSNQLLFFEANGEGKLKALCNGDATSQTSFCSSYMNLFNGKLIAIVESSQIKGNIEIHAFGSYLKEDRIIINVK
ncbi:MAG: beta-galactosidase [Dysgonomonas sp. 37-18]|nr:MAG: beta-galactosidase [Dysgonomonas sp. 37-18]